MRYGTKITMKHCRQHWVFTVASNSKRDMQTHFIKQIEFQLSMHVEANEQSG